MKYLNVGKVPIEVLNNCVFTSKEKVFRKEVLLRPNIGEDCSAIKLEDEIFLISSDPITGTTKNIGYFAVIVNCNDIWASGGEPLGIMVNILMPVGSTETQICEIMKGVYKGAKENNIEIIGGHTEVTSSVNKGIVTATIVGKSKKLITSSDAKMGEDIVVTKWIGIEGTIIIKNEMGENIELTIDNNYMSIEKEAKIAKEFGVSTMHDITEGGILGAVYELAYASKVGVNLILEDIPVLEETLNLCKKYSLNPYKLMSSGSLLITTDKGKELVQKLKKSGVNATIIGKIIKSEKKYIFKGKEYTLEEPTSDEIYKLIK